MLCNNPKIIKNEFISAFIGTFGISLAISFVMPLSAFSVYITSYIHEKQKFVTMHYGLFIHLIFAFAITFGISIGGFLELKLGFYLTTLLGLLIILACNIVFLNVQNIWLCYFLAFFMSAGAGISNSLTGKNLAFFKPGSKGFLMSVLGAITTLFSGTFSITGEKLINPDGHTLNKTEEYYEYKYSSKTYIYFTIGFFTIPIGVILYILFIIEYNQKESKSSREKKEKKEETETNEKKEEKKNENEDEEKINIIKDENGNDENKKVEEEDMISTNIQEINKKHKIKKVIKTFRFWRVAISLFLITFSFSFILGTGRTFGALIGINGKVLQILTLCQSGANILFGPLLGFLVDKKGPLLFLRIFTVLLVIPGILLTFFTKNSIIFIISFVISVLGFISSLVCVAPFMMDVYGIQESVILGGIANVFAKIADVITTVVSFVISFFYNKEQILVPYRIMYIVGSVCCIVSFILLMFEKKDKFDYGDEDKEDIGDIVEKGRFTETSV